LLYDRAKGTEDEDIAHEMLYSDDPQKVTAARRNMVESYTAVVQEYFHARVTQWLEIFGKKEQFGIKHFYL
jgi:hypothetical protein